MFQDSCFLTIRFIYFHMLFFFTALCWGTPFLPPLSVSTQIAGTVCFRHPRRPRNTIIVAIDVFVLFVSRLFFFYYILVFLVSLSFLSYFSYTFVCFLYYFFIIASFQFSNLIFLLPRFNCSKTCVIKGQICLNLTLFRKPPNIPGTMLARRKRKKGLIALEISFQLYCLIFWLRSIV